MRVTFCLGLLLALGTLGCGSHDRPQDRPSGRERLDRLVRPRDDQRPEQAGAVGHLHLQERLGPDAADAAGRTSSSAAWAKTRSGAAASCASRVPKGLRPGASSAPLTVKSQLGYTGTEPRQQMLANWLFVDARGADLRQVRAPPSGRSSPSIPSSGSCSPNDRRVHDVAAKPLASLDRRLGPIDAAAIVVSNVIGGGIFFTADHRRAARAERSWLFMLGLARSVACSPSPARWPMPNWRRSARARAASTSTCATRSADSSAFLTGWTSFVAGFSGAIAASAVALAEYIGRFVPIAARRHAAPHHSAAVRPVGRFTAGLVALAAIVLIAMDAPAGPRTRSDRRKMSLRALRSRLHPAVPGARVRRSATGRLANLQRPLAP